MFLFWKKVVDVLLPPLCLLCDEPVGETGTVCPACWGRLRFISPPFCAGCGTPFDFPVDAGTLCASCLTDPPVFKGARAALIYDDASRALILGFKHGDKTYLSKALGTWMQRAGGDLIAGADALVPVPLHRRRLFHRRYNQAALLAQEIGRLSGKPVLFDALQRVRATPAQGHLTRAERRKNVKGAFRLDPAQKAAIEGKTILLIDDVMTTGATINECARVLIDAGAKNAFALSLARVKGFD
jgi:ComF family protein